MPRNLDKRVEILFPVEDVALKDELLEIVSKQLLDTERTHVMMPDGRYVKNKVKDEDKLDSQKHFCEMAMQKKKKKRKLTNKKFFEPIMK